MDSSLKRRTVKMKSPNPLFYQWISEWRDESKKRGLDIHVKFEKALESLRKYPIVLHSGKECMILEHFDAALCIRLDRKLAEHKINNPQAGSIPDNRLENNEKFSNAVEEKGKKNKSYLPKPRSAPYALLVTLLKAGHPMSKAELQEAAQPHCDTSLTRCQAGTYFSGWSSMGKLVSKGLVCKISHPPKYELTPEGAEIAKIIQGQPQSQLDARSILAPIKRGKAATEQYSSIESQVNSQPSEDIGLVFLPGSFNVILLVDTAEAPGFLNSAVPSDPTTLELQRLGVKFEVRHLKIGDFTWIARHRENGSELVLPYIVERKRVDDLSKSIHDGRFHEQKFRLKQCKIPNLIYLVELCSGVRTGLPISSIHQAVVNTRVIDKFTVKVTSSRKESMSYLATLSFLLSNIFEKKTLFSSQKESEIRSILQDAPDLITFQNFSQGTGKNEAFSVREMFLKQLVQLHGVSAEKAWSIVDKFESPFALIQACLNTQDENFLADFKYGHLQRKLGTQTSQTLFKFYSSVTFPQK